MTGDIKIELELMKQLMESAESDHVVIKLDAWVSKDKDGNRWFSANGRDVDLEDSLLQYNEATRNITLNDINLTPQQSKLQTLVHKIIQIVTDNPGINSTQLFNETGGHKSDFNAARDQATSLNHIRQQNVGNARIYYPAGIKAWNPDQGENNAISSW
jgi:hypothetical protein